LFKTEKSRMRILLAIIAILVGGLFGRAVTYSLPVNDKDKEKLIIQAVFTLIKQRHFKDATLDDDYSRKVFKTYLERLDGSKRFLTIEDLDLLDDYADQ